MLDAGISLCSTETTNQMTDPEVLSTRGKHFHWAAFDCGRKQKARCIHPDVDLFFNQFHVVEGVLPRRDRKNASL